MKNVGATRKLDELGRIVIPKEIRRSFRIQEGETLEIFTTEDSIILKKFSRVKNISDFATVYCKAIASYIDGTVLIANCETIVAGKGPLENELVGKILSNEFSDMVKEGTFFATLEKTPLTIIEGTEMVVNMVVAPIVSSNESIGAVIIIFDDKSIDEQAKLATKIAADFLSRYIDK